MTLSLFWSRYVLELKAQHAREIDALYMYLIAREKWDWFIQKIPESVQVQVLREHQHDRASWTCRKWLAGMQEWIRENKSETVYKAVKDRIEQIEQKPVEVFEKSALHTVSDEELARLQQAGYFKGACKRVDKD